MNYDQMTGVIRSVVPPLLAYAVGKGWIAEGSVGDITTAIVAVGAAIWSVQNNKNTSKIASVAALPEVKKIVTTPEVANTGPLAPVPNVVSQ